MHVILDFTDFICANLAVQLLVLIRLYMYAQAEQSLCCQHEYC